jgi:DNA-binding beta-propeller fold protein YncE
MLVRHIAVRSFMIVLLGLVVACSAPQVQKKRYFWPPFSSEPKLEYIKFIQSDADVLKISMSKVEEVIFGRERPVPLFTSPFDVYSNGRGKIYVSEPSQGFVHVVDHQRGKLDRLKAGLPGRDLELKSPTGISGTADGTIYVVDSHAGAILIFGSDGRQQEQWDLDGIDRPVNLTIDEKRERVFVVAPDQHKVFVLSQKDGSILWSFGGRGIAPGEFNFPLDLDLDQDGNLYVLDAMNARVQVFSPEGDFLRMFGERGTALGSFQIPKGIAVSRSGHVYVTDSMSHRFVVFDRDGTYLLTIGGKFVVNSGEIAPGGFYLPGGIDIDDSEGIWVIDALNRIVHQFQYLNEEYLEKHPYEEGPAVVPAAAPPSLN